MSSLYLINNNDSGQRRSLTDDFTYEVKTGRILMTIITIEQVVGISYYMLDNVL